MILDLDGIETGEQEGGLSEQGILSITLVPSSLSASAQNSFPPTVKIRVLHTRQELAIYPNGESFIRNTQVWFEDKIYDFKKKEKPKPKETAKVQIKQIEEW